MYDADAAPVDRLRQDIVRLVHAAIPKRRSLVASEAKSLSILKQKLAKPGDTLRLWSIDLGDKVSYIRDIPSA
jgi:hypothetical protein